MDELVTRLVLKAGLGEEQAQRTIEIVLGFLIDAAPPDKVDRLLSAIPGSRDMDLPKPGAFGGMLGTMNAFSALTAAGLDMGQIKASATEILAYSREKAGADLVDDVVASVPVLARLA